MPTAHWTPEQAREMAVRGNLAKARIRAAMREAAALADELAQAPTYTDRVKARVRAQIQICLTRIDEELARGTKIDGAKLDRLASALERLAELERVLDGRPGPGNRRPPREDPPAVRPVAQPRPPAIPQPSSTTPPREAPPSKLSEPPDL